MPRYGGLYPVAGCVHWYINLWKMRAAERRKEIAPTQARREELELTVLEARAKGATGHLVDRNDVMMVWTSAYMRLGRMLDALPASIGRELNLDPDTLRAMRARIDEARDNFVRDSQEYIDVVEVEKQTSGAAARAKRRV